LFAVTQSGVKNDELVGHGQNSLNLSNTCNVCVNPKAKGPLRVHTGLVGFLRVRYQLRPLGDSSSRASEILFMSGI